MKELSFELNLITSDSKTEILELHEFLLGEVPGLEIQLKENPESKEGAMSIELLPVLQIVLSSTAVAAGVKGLFTVLKDYFELRKQKYAFDSDKTKIQITKTSNDGKTETVSMHLFTENERKTLLEFINK
ncbi:MAG: hypothetical protein JNJ56_05530 [Ignavibacteria bacterium]|nr:hypothetical protein [Ignavibacteria bacterium]